MNYLIQDEIDRPVAVVETEPPMIASSSRLGQDLKIWEWATIGIPSLTGASFDGGDTIKEQTTFIAPDNALWGLALLEACDQRNWKLVEQATVAASEFKEELHPRNPKGAEHGGQFTAKHESVEERALPVKKSLNVADMEQVAGSLGGSTPAAQYKDKDGVMWYVKSVKGSENALNEVLAARLYNLAGVKTPEVQTIKLLNGKLGVASKIVELKGSASFGTPGATEGFAADAWLANWDVVGKSMDNLQVDKHGNAIRIDVGGSMVFRAQGGNKAEYFTGTVGEVNSLRDPNGSNPTSPKVFSEMTPEMVKESILGTVAKVTDDQIISAINTIADDTKVGLGTMSLQDLKKRLMDRRDFLVKLANEKTAAKPKAEPVDDKPKITGEIFSHKKEAFPEEIYQPLVELYEPNPGIPGLLQIKSLQQAAMNIGKPADYFGIHNWDDPAHPRPDSFGVPTNTKSMEFQRLFQIGHEFLGNWKGSAQSPGASSLKRAAQRVFGAKGIIYGGHGATVDSADTAWDNDRVVRMMYRDTQERFKKKGMKYDDRIELYRGVSNECPQPGVLEGYSYSHAAAKGFDGHGVYTKWVNPADVLADNKSKFFEGTGFHFKNSSELEWVVFAGGVGAPVSATKFDKAGSISKSTPAAVAASGIANFSTGKAKPYAPPKTPHPLATAVAKEQADSKWTKITDAHILTVKELHGKGVKSGTISKQLNIAPSTIHGIIHGTSKKYAQTGPRSKNMKKLLQVSEHQWNSIKQNVGAAVKKTGMADFKAIGEAVGVTEWKAKSIWFSQSKKVTI